MKYIQFINGFISAKFGGSMSSFSSHWYRKGWSYGSGIARRQIEKSFYPFGYHLFFLITSWQRFKWTAFKYGFSMPFLFFAIMKHKK